MASNSGKNGSVLSANVQSPDARAARAAARAARAARAAQRAHDEAEAAAREAQRVRDEAEEDENSAAAFRVALADATTLRASAPVESAMKEAPHLFESVAVRDILYEAPKGS